MNGGDFTHPARWAPLRGGDLLVGVWLTGFDRANRQISASITVTIAIVIAAISSDESTPNFLINR